MQLLEYTKQFSSRQLFKTAVIGIVGDSIRNRHLNIYYYYTTKLVSPNIFTKLKLAKFKKEYPKIDIVTHFTEVDKDYNTARGKVDLKIHEFLKEYHKSDINAHREFLDKDEVKAIYRSCDSYNKDLKKLEKEFKKLNRESYEFRIHSYGDMPFDEDDQDLNASHISEYDILWLLNDGGHGSCVSYDTSVGYYKYGSPTSNKIVKGRSLRKLTHSLLKEWIDFYLDDKSLEAKLNNLVDKYFK